MEKKSQKQSKKMETMELRDRIWKVRKRFEFEKDLSTSIFGMEVVNGLSEKLEIIERRIAVAEYQLQVPGGKLNEKFGNDVDVALTFIYSSFRNKKCQPDKAYEVLEKLLSASIPNAEMLPLVMEEEMSNDEYGNRIKKSKESIIDMLMKFHDDDKWSVIPVIGKPGTGKTTLTQHLYHDKSVCEHFVVRHLVCMSDIHGGSPSKLLDQVFKHKTNDAEILEKFHSLVDGKRYLLILDGVANEDQVVVLLHDLLCKVGEGSKVIITAYNMSAIGKSLPMAIDGSHELESPSVDECWAMFQSIAIDGDAAKSNQKYVDNLKLAREFCSKYASIPRLLNNVATLLRDSEDWEHICNRKFENVNNASDSILSKVDLRSFEELPSKISDCLVYCSMFPVSQGYRFSKEDLVHLWDAQGYLSIDENSPEKSVGDEYFDELQNMWYLFEEVEQDNYYCSTVISYNMDPAVNEFLKTKGKHLLRYEGEDLSDSAVATILHLSIPIVRGEWRAPSWLSKAKQLKSLLFLPCTTADVGIFQDIDKVLSVLRQLQSLDLAGVNCEPLPDSLGGLTELRYLRLGVSSVSLPQSIIKLSKLQTLDLRHSSVMVLPPNFHELEGLKHLYTGDRLVDLPPNFDKLKSLQTLDAFIVGDNNSINALSQLNRLVGKLIVRYQKPNKNVSQPKSEGIFRDKLLTDLSLIWSSSYKKTDTNDVHNYLQPPQSLKSLALCGWKEVSFPQLLMNAFPYLYGLVSLQIKDCSSCQLLPALSALPNLTSLELWNLKKLRCMETLDSSSTTTTCMFPSLKSLVLANLPELQGWFSVNDDGHNFPSLVKLRVSDCQKLMSLPQMPSLELLEMQKIREKLLHDILSGNSTLKSLTIVSVHQLESLPTSLSLLNLEELVIRNCPHLTALPQSLGDLSTLRLLEIHSCSTLNKIPDNFKSLENLNINIKKCPMLPTGGQQQDDQN